MARTRRAPAKSGTAAKRSTAKRSVAQSAAKAQSLKRKAPKKLSMREAALAVFRSNSNAPLRVKDLYAARVAKGVGAFNGVYSFNAHIAAYRSFTRSGALLLLRKTASAASRIESFFGALRFSDCAFAADCATDLLAVLRFAAVPLFAGALRVRAILDLLIGRPRWPPSGHERSVSARQQVGSR